MTESDDAPTLVEQALAALRDAPVPEGPSPHLLHATAVRLQSHASPGDTCAGISEHSVRSKCARYSGLVAACAAGIATVTWFGLIDHSAKVAFADVQEQVKMVRSVQYLETRLPDKQPDEKRDPKAVAVESNADNPRRHFVLGRFLHRTEVLNADGQIESVGIFNAKTGKWVDLNPKTKRCQILGTQVTIDGESGKQTETAIQAAPRADFYSEIREIPAEATTQLPAKIIGDRHVVGFVWEQKFEKKNGTDTWKRTYWVDPRTKLPVRVEVSHRSTDKRMGPSDWVRSDFIFDKELDESLFSTEPPEGYTTETSKIYGIQQP